MSTIHLLGFSLAAVLSSGVVIADTPPSAGMATPPADVGSKHIMLNTGDLKWGDAPPGLPKGAKATVLEGDPSKPGPFTIRAEFPPKYQIKPHWHPAIEHVTVLSGELFMGSGKTYNEAEAHKLSPGGFAVMPTRFEHYAFTRGQKTVIQLHGIGPWGITYVNPGDDPRTAQK